MTAPHTSALDHALTDALHTGTPHADSVEVTVLERDEAGQPTMYRVATWHGRRRFSGRSASVGEALTTAMTRLRVHVTGGI